MSNKLLAVLILAFATMTCYAGYGGHLEYNGNFHPGYDNTYHQDDNLYYHSEDAVVIGVPAANINPTYPYSCPLIQQCYPSGNCVETQDCN